MANNDGPRAVRSGSALERAAVVRQTSDAQFRPFAAPGIRTTTARFVGRDSAGRGSGAILPGRGLSLGQP